MPKVDYESYCEGMVPARAQRSGGALPRFCLKPNSQNCNECSKDGRKNKALDESGSIEVVLFLKEVQAFLLCLGKLIFLEPANAVAKLR
jgi:hypothetical protein